MFALCEKGPSCRRRRLCLSSGGWNWYADAQCEPHSAVASICICACAWAWACLMWREFNILTSGAGYQICLLLLHITHNRMGKVIAGDCISGTTWRIINIPLSSSLLSTNWSKNEHNNHYYYRARALEVDPCVRRKVEEVEGSLPLMITH